jgi:hypothetical protein
MKDKSGPEKLQGLWILELGKLTGMRKVDSESVKSFLSRNDDKYRASYGVSVENHPRQCIIVGTINAEQGFLFFKIIYCDFLFLLRISINCNFLLYKLITNLVLYDILSYFCNVLNLLTDDLCIFVEEAFLQLKV